MIQYSISTPCTYTVYYQTVEVQTYVMMVAYLACCWLQNIGKVVLSDEPSVVSHGHTDLSNAIRKLLVRYTLVMWFCYKMRYDSSSLSSGIASYGALGPVPLSTSDNFNFSSSHRTHTA